MSRDIHDDALNQDSVEESPTFEVVSASAINPITKRRFHKNIAIVCLVTLMIVAIVGAFYIFQAMTSPYKIDAINFTDSAVRQAVRIADVDNDGWITRDEAANLVELEINNAKSVTELKIFPNLATLTLSGSALENVDVSSMGSLNTLTITDSSISTLDLSGLESLETLDLTGSQVETLDISPCKNIKNLLLDQTLLTTVDISANTLLENLSCDESLQVVGLEFTQLSEQWLITQYVCNVGGDSSGNYDYTLQTDITYDASNKITAIALSGDDIYGNATYTYDEEGKLVSAVIASSDGSSSWKLTYDEQGRLTLAADSANRVDYSYTYDEQNRVAAYTITSQDSEDSTTYSYAYDDNGLVVRIECDDPINLTYDEAGRLVSYVSESGDRSHTITYDEAGRCISIVSDMDDYGIFTENFTYDEDGNLNNATRTVERSALYYLRDLWPFSSDDEAFPAVTSMQFSYDENQNIVNATAWLEDLTSNYAEITYKRVFVAKDSVLEDVGYANGDPIDICFLQDWRYIPWILSDPFSSSDGIRDVAFGNSYEQVTKL